MDRQPSDVDFAVIGHQEDWRQISSVMNAMRMPGLPPHSENNIKDIFSFIPPRDLFRIYAASKEGKEVQGIYIETFISPDNLDVRHLRANIHKVQQAIAYAKRKRVRIAAMGGFTSIVLEGEIEPYQNQQTVFTTGNTLTSAFIVKGIESAAGSLGIDISSASMLILGATGDIGAACGSYFKKKVNRFLLCARNSAKLEGLTSAYSKEGIKAESSTIADQLLPLADIVIAVSSATGFDLKNCKSGALICDAGYPKNIYPGPHLQHVHLFHGGMGRVHSGFRFDPDYAGGLYHFPLPHISHGCILEAVVLAFEKRFEPFSSGRGKITPAKMETIYTLSLKNGITLAPFYNSQGLW